MAEDQVVKGYIEITRIPTRISANGQKYKVMAGDEVLVESCAAPILDGARELLAAGSDIDDVLILRDLSGTEIMRGRIGDLAHARVAEGIHHGPRFAEWSPYFGPGQEDS